MGEQSASLAWLLSQNCRYIALHCRTLGCKGGGKSVDVMEYVLRLGEGATLAQIERAARCNACGVKGYCWAEPVCIHSPRMGLGENGWPQTPSR